MATEKRPCNCSARWRGQPVGGGVGGKFAPVPLWDWRAWVFSFVSIEGQNGAGGDGWGQDIRTEQNEAFNYPAALVFFWGGVKLSKAVVGVAGAVISAYNPALGMAFVAIENSVMSEREKKRLKRRRKKSATRAVQLCFVIPSRRSKRYTARRS